MAKRPRAMSREESDQLETEQAVRIYGDIVSPAEARRIIAAVEAIQALKPWTSDKPRVSAWERAQGAQMRQRAWKQLLQPYAEAFGHTERLTNSAAQSQALFTLRDLARG